MRRKKEKLLKSRLTDEQYNNLTKQANTQMMNDQVRERTVRFMTEFALELGNVMRSNNISQARTDKIIKETFENYTKKLESEDNDHHENIS